MRGFNFEKDLLHQTQAVRSTVDVFKDIEIISPAGINKNYINPEINYLSNFQYDSNLRKITEKNDIGEIVDKNSNIIDIMMETGTGKTYTYAKTIFELNKNYQVFKFVVIVPTLSIKAGTIDFLNSESARKHFKDQYGKTLNLHIVHSQKGGKNKKNFMPPAISSFVNAGTFEKNKIQVMIINAGMVNSDTMHKDFDRSIFDKYTSPAKAIAAVKPFLIIDEPHKFAKSNKTWENIEKIKPQFILRYGATFPEKTIKKKGFTGAVEKIKIKDYHNLVYSLNAVDSFNQNLVKGIIGHITEFEAGKNILVKLLGSDGTEARFELAIDRNKKTFKVAKNECLEKVHSAMTDLSIERLNKSTVVLSNGFEMKKGDKINPYSYAETLQEKMIKKTIDNHFKIEKELLSREVKIKPLTLFFIDNIEEYRSEEGYIKKTVEQYTEARIRELLKTEKGFYKKHLEHALKDIFKTHGGYFSKDNSEKDELIEEEINEILHDKQSILDLHNPRRFIFSKWTLREGWDNPNVFQICKLRSSGSEISKLQEVGRGLRLPVNEYGNRVKDEQFYLNYFVDFTESDFIDKLVNEINEKSGAISIEENPEKLSANIISQIVKIYKIKEGDLLKKLDNENIISRNNDFKKGGFDYIKKNYSLIFAGVNSSKVRTNGKNRAKVTIRTEKYAELKELWEKLNEKVILEYKFENEDKFKDLFIEFLQQKQSNLSNNNVIEREEKIVIEKNQAIYMEEEIAPYNLTTVATMKYSDFLKQLAKVLNINIKTLHQAFIEANVDFNKYLSPATIRVISKGFNDFLMYKAIADFEIGYQRVSSSIHPTKLTNKKGVVLKEICAADIGIFNLDEKPADNYLFDELFFDSDLEMQNIKTKIKDVIVFTKIPQRSIRIPVAGGKSYSPDFAYVLNFENGTKKLYFIVETKDVDGEDNLRKEEAQKIKHAEQFFKDSVNIQFKSQFSNDKMVKLIQEIVK